MNAVNIVRISPLHLPVRIVLQTALMRTVSILLEPLVGTVEEQLLKSGDSAPILALIP